MGSKTISEVFDSAGEHTLDVPAEAENIWVELSGAGGGGGYWNDSSGGEGGYVEGYLPADVAGTTITINVGGGGVYGEYEDGGYNGGGGTGSASTGNTGSDSQPGSGGGASDIRVGGATLDDRVAVAGGGGGSAGSDSSHVIDPSGGDGGGLEGSDGESSNSSSGENGTGGTQTTGGVGGVDDSGTGGDGSYGTGGDGAGTLDAAPGGGGGGGWYGGGGGGSDGSGGVGGSGGGGSSYIDGLSNATTTTGGGSTGGSGYGDGADGQVVIEYDITVDAPDDLTVDATRDTEVDLSWTDADSEADGHRIYRSTDPGIDPGDREVTWEVLDSGDGATVENNQITLASYSIVSSESPVDMTGIDTITAQGEYETVLDVSSISGEYYIVFEASDTLYTLGIAESYNSTDYETSVSSAYISSPPWETVIESVEIATTNPGELVADLSQGTGNYTDTGLTNGTTYYYVIETYQADGEGGEITDLSNETSGQTTVPGIDAIEFDTTTLGELGVSWFSVLNTGEYRIEYREDGATDWLAHETVANDASPMSTIANLYDGWAYDVRIRGETSEVNGDWTEVSETTRLPDPGIQFPHVDETSIEADWTEANAPEATYTLERADAIDNRNPDPEFTAFAELVTGTPTYLDEGLQEPWPYRYRVTTETPYATINETRQVQTDFRFADNYTLELVAERNGESVHIPIYSRDITAAPGWRRELSAMASWQIDLPWTPGAEDWRFSEARIYYAGDLLLRGELTRIGSDDGAGITTLEGKDTLLWLDREGAADEFANAEVIDVLETYADKHVDDWAVLVADPGAEPVAEDDPLIDSATTSMADIIDSGPTAPIVADDENGEIRTAQTSFLFDSERMDEDASGATQRDHTDNDEITRDFTNGKGWPAGFESSNVVTELFEVEHTIPEDAVGMAARLKAELSPGMDLELWLYSVTEDEWLGEITLSGEFTEFTPQWYGTITDNPENVSEWIDGDVPPGEYVISAEPRGSSTNGILYIDCLNLLDTRYYDADDYDEITHEPAGHLDSPHDYAEVTHEMASADAVFNVDQASLDTGLADGEIPVALQLSNNSGADWLPADGSEEDTTSITVDFAAAEAFGATVDARVTLAGYEPDGPRETVSPRYGYESQAITDWEIRVWTTDRPIVDEIEVVGSHFQNVRDLCDAGGFGIVPIYHADELILLATQPGQLTPTDLRGMIADHPDLGQSVADEVALPESWVTLDHSREVDVEDYANQVTVFGAYDETNEEWVEVTITADTEVERVGQVVGGRPIFEESTEDTDTLRNVARNELRDRTVTDRLGGSEEIVPIPVVPGLVYDVDVLDGETLPLYSAEFDDAGGASGSLEWSEPKDFAAALTDLSETVRRLQF